MTERDRIDELEHRVRELERRADARPAVARTTPAGAEPEESGGGDAGDRDAGDRDAGDRDVFWALDGLRRRVESPGAVLYTGVVETPAGGVEWQYALPVESLVERPWTAWAATLAALGNPVRLAILQAVYGGASTVAELSEAAELTSTGQVYHHLQQLVAQGWLAQTGRGRYGLLPERVVPLLAVLTASVR